VRLETIGSITFASVLCQLKIYDKNLKVIFLFALSSSFLIPRVLKKKIALFQNQTKKVMIQK